MDNTSDYSNIFEKVKVVDLFHHYVFWVELFLKNICGLFMSFSCWSHIHVKKEFRFLYYSSQKYSGHDWTMLLYPIMRVLCDFSLTLRKRLNHYSTLSYLSLWYRTFQTQTFHITKPSTEKMDILETNVTFCIWNIPSFPTVLLPLNTDRFFFLFQK